MRTARRAALLLAVLGCGAGTAAAGTPDVAVPSFWDPAAIPERPAVEAVKTIRFVTEEDHPPFVTTLRDGTLAGFDVDLARALCEELKVSCTIQTRRFDTIVPALKAGGADAAIASLAITDAASDDVDFTAPYYKTPARFAGRAGGHVDPIGPDTLAGKRVGVERGTAHEAFVKTFFPAAELRPFPAVADAEAALKSGAVDLVFGDGITLAGWLGSKDAAGCCAFVGGPYTESRFFGEGAGIAVRRGNAVLRAALDHALGRIAASGRYGDLYLKYFPIGIY